ncbi:GEMC1 protein, partial [Amia calva]|nr:GEMC1 protein [Amia calva]
VLSCQDQCFAGGQGYGCPYSVSTSQDGVDVSKETLVSFWAAGLLDNPACQPEPPQQEMNMFQRLKQVRKCVCSRSSAPVHTSITSICVIYIFLIETFAQHSSSSTKNLGVALDPALSYTQHITTLTRSCRFFLSNIRQIRPFLTDYSTELLVQSLVLSRLDYCNSLLAGLPASTTRPLQLIQNSAARLLFSLPRFTHATPLLCSLHWLLIPARIQFKTLTLTYHCLCTC